ncbi:MAG: hypothetical protein F6K31_18635 [Symploca sp. SIO2G7]|nr:hypothetical protein [Symploca sp. SIO2G7]
MVYRRLLAWCLELNLVTMSAVVPWGIGLYIHRVTALKPIGKTAETVPIWLTERTPMTAQVPLSPMVEQVQQGWSRMAQIPPHQLHRTVPRLTNILWTLAVIAPGVVAGGQLLQLKYTGRTWAKQWLGIQVFSMTGAPLRLRQILRRELWRWGLPMVVVGGVGLTTELSFGQWTPLVIGLLAVAEGMSAIAPDQRAWHDRIANTQVMRITAEYLPVTRDVTQTAIEESCELNGLTQPDSLQLYGETMGDDEWWLSEADGNLTSVILAPRSKLVRTQPVRCLMSFSKPLSHRFWWLLAGGMVMAGAVGFGMGRFTRLSDRTQTQEDIFLEVVQKLIAKSQTGVDYSAAILMLAQVDDSRTPQYLVDLLSQSSQPEVLSTIQQALISQGLDSVPALLSLNHSLERDLRQPLDDDARHTRLEQRHCVQTAIAKLLTIHSGELMGLQLNRVNLGHHHDADRTFRLIQPGLLAAGTSWQGASLSYANLANASFFDPGPDGKVDTYDDIISDLDGSNLIAVSLERANLQGAQLPNADLRRANLGDANLTYSNLNHAQLTNARLIHINAPKSRWQSSNLVGADLTQAFLQAADFTQARLNRIEAAHSDWTRAVLPQSNWMGANLIGANFSEADLSRANFQGANLDSVNFTRADLQQANLRETDLSQATLIEVNLTDADLANAKFNNSRGVNDSFITPNTQLNGTHLQGVDFSRVHNLSDRQLNYICAQGGVHPTCPRALSRAE